MLKNYFKTALRSLKKQGVFATMNVIGLSTGIACFILISLFVRDELTFDKFHEKTDRIYRGLNVIERGFYIGFSEKEIELVNTQMPEVEELSLLSFGRRVILNYEGQLVFEKNHYEADSEIFDIFDFSLLYGNEKDALVSERSIVISQYIMNKYFNGENPLGKLLKINKEEKSYLITGVLNEIPDNSSLHFNFLTPTSYRTNASSNQLYILLKSGTTRDSFENSLAKLAEDHDLYNEGYLTEPFGDLYLESEHSFSSTGVSGDKQFLWVFGAIGIVLLLISCINYINSSTARALNRNKEIGVRRIIGATGGQIRYQFLMETFFTSIIAVLLSAGLVEQFLPILNSLSGKKLSMNYFSDPYTLLFLLSIVPLVTVLAGLYPAMFSSRMGTLNLLHKNRSVGKGHLRNSLVVFQFVITLTLIFVTQIVVKQVNVLEDTQVGLKADNIISFRRPGKSDFDLFKNTFEQVAGVEAVTTTIFPYASIFPQAIQFEERSILDSLTTYYYYVSPNAPEVFNLNMIKGEIFNTENQSLYKSQILISQKVARMLPFEDPVGKQIKAMNDDDEYEQMTILGVYQNLNFNAKEESLPTIMLTTKASNHFMNLKLTAENQEETILKLSNAWSQISPDQPFQYQFLNDRIAANYEKERKFGTIFKHFAGIAVLIAALGLLGLSAFTVVQKYKEIAIRKALGATVLRVTTGLMTKYLGLILLATLLAIPLAYFLMDSWLNDFANREPISFSIFLLGFGMALAVLVLTVGYQTLKAAFLNPVDVLKDE